MSLSSLDYALWVACFLSNAALFAVLIVRNRWREFPVFTTLIGYEAIVSAALYLIYSRGSYVWFTRIYWPYALFDFVLQLWVIWEIAHIVLKPTGTWVQDARKQFILWGAAGILLAATLPWLVTPPAATLFHRLEVRGNLFTSLVICELIAVVTRTSKSLGLGWRSHVMALGNGWTVWAVVAIMVDGLHSYLGAELYFRQLEHLRMFAYLAALSYWMVRFWLEEPARRPISPELREYILVLHQRIKNDLDTLNAQR
ncbi:MAG: hypothetical protein ABSE51_01775 [Terracidiphilus sp.]|jgi:hypothetical protein